MQQKLQQLIQLSENDWAQQITIKINYCKISFSMITYTLYKIYTSNLYILATYDMMFGYLFLLVQNKIQKMKFKKCFGKITKWMQLECVSKHAWVK